MIKVLTEDQMTLQIIKVLKEGKKKEFQAILEELQPYDIARILKGSQKNTIHASCCYLIQNKSLN